MQAAVCVERHCTTDHWHATSWSHHAITVTMRTTLAIHPRACQVQSGMSGSPVAVHAGTSLLGTGLLPVSDSTRRHLRSANAPTCMVPWTLITYGDRSLAAAGPRLWYYLPFQLLHNLDITYKLFRRQRKGHLFQEAWIWRYVIFDTEYRVWLTSKALRHGTC